ncbi:MAG: RNA 2',3'-cyclic phosphodiesterase, partial [Acidobacteria bacterium]|nr:RNA 2',3'-cyclic phosphodiesterase [Acidobacteriota bacterium]
GLGISPEKRPLRPHLTLGRFRTPRRDPRLAQVVLDLADRELARQTVREFFLFQSRLSREGAEYSKLKRFEFARPRHGL